MNRFHHPPVYFFLTTFLGYGMGRWINLPFHFPDRTYIFSGILFVISGVIGFVSIIQFKLKGTSVRPFEETTVLVKNGFYRFTRNPMYLGLLFLQVAILSAFSEPVSLVVVPLLWWILHKSFVLEEEQLLLQKFGENYQLFLSNTRRWL